MKKDQIKYMFLTTMSLLLIVLFACRKEQPEIKPPADLCACANEVSADFDILERSALSVNALLTLTDTVFKNKYVEFQAKEENAEYTWYIGLDVETTQTAYKLFDNTWAGSDIPITLVVKKDPNTTCFPDDDGYDSVVKTFHVSEYVIIDGQNLDLGSIAGTYRVKSPHLADSFDIEFYGSLNFQNTAMFNILNYDGEGSNCINQARITDGNYRQVKTMNGTGALVCDALRGYIHNRLDGVTEMHFSFGSTGPSHPDYYERTYLGRKLP